MPNAMIQLDPAIDVMTKLGSGAAIIVIDYGMHQNTCWVVALHEDGQVKHFDGNQIKLCKNHTYCSGHQAPGRRRTS